MQFIDPGVWTFRNGDWCIKKQHNESLTREFNEPKNRQIRYAGMSKRGSCSCVTMLLLPSHLNPEETGLPGLSMSWSPTLFPGSGPDGLPTVPWTEKQLKGHHFPSDVEAIAAAETWLEGQHFEIFLSVLQKLEQRAKKCIELRGGLCWINTECGRCSLFTSWSG